jgi:hypothetical protein
LNKETNARTRANKDIPFKHIHMSPSRIDAILDKISERGINALTNEERRLLDDYSKSKKES